MSNKFSFSFLIFHSKRPFNSFCLWVTLRALFLSMMPNAVCLFKLLSPALGVTLPLKHLSWISQRLQALFRKGAASGWEESLKFKQRDRARGSPRAFLRCSNVTYLLAVANSEYLPAAFRAGKNKNKSMEWCIWCCPPSWLMLHFF